MKIWYELQARTSKGITTETGVPGVQTETSVEVDKDGFKSTQSGVASGVKFPIMVSPTGLTHISLDISLKLKYEKDPDGKR